MKNMSEKEVKREKKRQKKIAEKEGKKPNRFFVFLLRISDPFIRFFKGIINVFEEIIHDIKTPIPKEEKFPEEYEGFFDNLSVAMAGFLGSIVISFLTSIIFLSSNRIEGTKLLMEFIMLGTVLTVLAYLFFLMVASFVKPLSEETPRMNYYTYGENEYPLGFIAEKGLGLLIRIGDLRFKKYFFKEE